MPILSKLAVFAMTVAVAAAQLTKMGASESVGPSLLKIAHQVNANPKSTWKAGLNQNWNGYTVGEMKKLMGVVFDEDLKVDVRPPFTAQQYRDTPASLDLRTRQYQNTSCVGPVLDQAKCGSCWAFGATEAISDRLCMKKGTFLQLGPLDLVTCDQNDGGCEGGDPGSAWQYAQGGLATDKCIPYLQSAGGPIPTCPPATEPCLDFVNTPNCPTTCGDGSAIDRSQGVVGNVYQLGSVQDMMTELDQNGPFEVAFTVYSDFLTYKSGVYQYTTGDALGGHAVKIIGYGTENNTPYWQCQNSWTTTWGDGGYFKILRGQDECGIEDDAVAGTISA